MKISIIITGYNREKYIEKCLKSVINQTYKNWQIILVDDGSTDKTPSLMKKYAAKFPNIAFYEKTHSGCWSTKNFAIKIAETDYIFFLDSDDFLVKDYLENGINFMQKYPNYEYYYPPKLKVTDENGNLQNFVWKYLNYNDENKWQIFYYFLIKANGGIPHVGSFIKKDIFEKLGFYDETLVNLADLKYILINAFQIKMRMIPNWIGYCNRQHSNQINKSPERLETILKLMCFVVQKYPPHFFRPEFKENNINPIEQKHIVYQDVISKFMDGANQNKSKKDIFLKYAKYLLSEDRKL